MFTKQIYIGLDIGSTTVKLALIEPSTNKLIYNKYVRHQTRQINTACNLLNEVAAMFPDASFKIAVTGSGGETFSRLTEVPFIQEVAANTLAIQALYPEIRTAIELGGQDAKVVFFRDSSIKDGPEVDDMRMNGVCAGGTGSFIDQISALLEVRPEEFDELASKGNTVYNISGRCGVFATTDIQTLLNQGVSKEDVALSSLHAIANQTIGGLAQGKKFYPKVIFEGGVLSFNPTLISVFQKHLSLDDKDIFVPDHPEIMVAFGAAISLVSFFKDMSSAYLIPDLIMSLKNHSAKDVVAESHSPFFASEIDKELFLKRLCLTTNSDLLNMQLMSNLENLDIYIGIDSGSTTAKLVFLNSDCEVIDSFYSRNHGNPIETIRNALIKLEDKYLDKGIHLNVKGIGTTGYGEELIATALNADFHTVETLAHSKSASTFLPDVSFILDIGGQDIKGIFINNKVITRIILNEACSSGCGSFLENYSTSINIDIKELAHLAFASESPSYLGSRCTIFMNSSITNELKAGKPFEDIAAGLCHSLVENIFTKVIRIYDFNELGPNILIQGGVSLNDAVIRSIEMFLGKEVHRPQHPELMGAIGVALLTMESQKEHSLEEKTSSKPVFDSIRALKYAQRNRVVCECCSNHCSRTITKFNNGNIFTTGHKCEKGNGHNTLKPLIKNGNKDFCSTNLLNDFISQSFDQSFGKSTDASQNGLIIGIPRVLEFYESYPFWKTFLEYFGNKVVLSPESSFKLMNHGLPFVPSDTVCLPGKIAHGHIVHLSQMNIDRIFWPMMICKPVENPTSQTGSMCPVVQGYSLLAKNNHDLDAEAGIMFDTPIFHWNNNRLMVKQMVDYFTANYGYHSNEIKHAISLAIKSQRLYKKSLQDQGINLLKKLESTDLFGVVIAGRPYQYDRFINHNLAEYFTELGIPVFTIENLPNIHNTNVSPSRNDNHIIYHTRIIEAAYFTALHPNLELVQLISFSCGHDSVLSDEVRRIMRTSRKEPLPIKLDEMDTGGSLKLRIKSFIETIRSKRKSSSSIVTSSASSKLYRDPYPVKFTKKDKKFKTILAPHLTPTFSYAAAKIFESQGFRFVNLPLGGSRAFQLGKKYLHNDICFPAQVNIGEIFLALESGNYNKDEVAVILSKNCDYCRSGQYQVVARKALDQNGYENVPILTTGKDWKDIHPGYSLNIDFKLKILRSLASLDLLEQMCRATRPYEVKKGTANAVFLKWREIITDTVINSPKKIASRFDEAVNEFNNIPIFDVPRKPRIGIVGEILVEYHEKANRNIESYLEDHGIEVYKPSVYDFFRRDPLMMIEMSKRSMVPNAWLRRIFAEIEEGAFRNTLASLFSHYRKFRFAEDSHDAKKIMEHVTPIVDKTYFAGEGWLIPGSILEMVNYGINSFIVMQPFSCMSNHITGRGLFKTLKKLHPSLNLLAIDFDPDTSMANIQNRLQMLIHATKDFTGDYKKYST